MNHIVVNNYTNAGLSILFLIVVYSIIFYGFKTWLKVRNSDKRTDKETPYVPIPEGGVERSLRTTNRLPYPAYKMSIVGRIRRLRRIRQIPSPDLPGFTHIWKAKCLVT